MSACLTKFHGHELLLPTSHVPDCDFRQDSLVKLLQQPATKKKKRQTQPGYGT